MRFFGKTVEGEIRSEIISRLALIAFSGMLLALGGFFSFAWFSQNRATDSNGMGVAVRTTMYEILVERTTRYDEGYDIITHEDYVKDSLLSDGYSFTSTSTSNDSMLGYELINEYRYENKYNLMPGSYGSLTFYLHPLVAGNLILDFDLSLGGYVVVADNTETGTFGEIQNDAILDLLKGHIMFFEGRSGADLDHYVYSGLITDGTFTYDTSQHVKCDEVGKTDYYKITLYWEWPITYYDIVEGLSTDEVTRRYPVEMTDYLTNTRYFFLSLPEGADLDDRSNAYNDADQSIGTNADCIVAFISAQ